MTSSGPHTLCTAYVFTDPIGPALTAGAPAPATTEIAIPENDHVKKDYKPCLELSIR
jgi:hypothetical protein